MTKIFTKHDVLRYFYDEVSKLEKEQIEDFLSCDTILRDYYSGLLHTEEKIESKLESPSNMAISNILNYSKSLCTTN